MICQRKLFTLKEWLTLKTSVLPSTYSGYLAFINSLEAKFQNTHNFCISLNISNLYGIATLCVMAYCAIAPQLMPSLLLRYHQCMTNRVLFRILDIFNSSKFKLHNFVNSTIKMTKLTLRSSLGSGKLIVS